MHRPGIEPGAGRHLRSEDLEMATANFTTKPPMLFDGEARDALVMLINCNGDCWSERRLMRRWKAVKE